MIKQNEKQIRIPAQAETILATLQAARFEAFVVGGCVRDCLLGRTPVDWDITTSALPSEVKSLFYNTVDTGIEHGTVMVLLDGSGYEVTTYRKDGKYSDARRPDEVEFTPSLEEDLKRRDFTINAFAYNHERGLVDLFDGRSDLENGIIRCVGDPDKRFSEDALRIMRAVRFAAQLSFAIEEQTFAAIRRHAENLGKISMERIRVEFEKTLLSANPSYVNLYRRLGLAEYILRGNEICARCFSEESEALYREMTKDRLGEVLTLAACAAQPQETQKAEPLRQQTKIRALRLAAFFRNLTPEEAGRALRGLTYDNQTKKTVASLLRYKDDPLPPDKRILKRALNRMGADILELVWGYRFAQWKADDTVKVGQQRCFAMREEEALFDAIEVTQDILASGEPYQISMLAVNGTDLIAAGVQKGTAVGEELERLLQIVIDAPEKNRREILLSMVRPLQENL